MTQPPTDTESRLARVLHRDRSFRRMVLRMVLLVARVNGRDLRARQQTLLRHVQVSWRTN